MFVKVTTRYRDKMLNAELPEGVILEVNDERAEVLINAKKAVKINLAEVKAAQSKNKKSEEIAEDTKVEEPVAEEATASTDAITEEDKWTEPKATETTGE